MGMGIFAQFASPFLLGIPLLALAVALPWLILPPTSRRLVDNRFRTLVDWFASSVTKHLLGPVGTKGHVWGALLVSIIVFIAAHNILGLLPYTFVPTCLLSFNLALAVPIWLATVLMGLRHQPTITFGHLLPEGTPIPLIPLMIIIESFSLLIRPVSLAVRLTANMTAGHLLLKLISTATGTALAKAPELGLLAFPAVVGFSLLEVAVAMIQAYVFVLLVTLYMQENIS